MAPTCKFCDHDTEFIERLDPYTLHFGCDFCGATCERVGESEYDHWERGASAAEVERLLTIEDDMAADAAAELCERGAV